MGKILLIPFFSKTLLCWKLLGCYESKIYGHVLLFFNFRKVIRRMLSTLFVYAQSWRRCQVTMRAYALSFNLHLLFSSLFLPSFDDFRCFAFSIELSGAILFSTIFSVSSSSSKRCLSPISKANWFIVRCWYVLCMFSTSCNRRLVSNKNITEYWI